MIRIWLVALLLSVPHLSRAQGNELIVGFSRASNLSGVVVNQRDDPFPKTAVSRIDCGEGEFRGTVNPIILQKVETDAKGNFAFPWHDHNRTCLQVQTPGMDTLQVEVTFAKSAGRLKLKLHVGT
jgi:hypothetical protein